MKILSYTANLDLNTFNRKPHYEVELTCDCSPEELNTLYLKHALDPMRELHLSEEPVKTKCKPVDVTPKFGGMITLQDGRQVYIKKVIYNKPAVIVFWSDDIKTRCTCHEDDIFNPEFGLTLCVMKRFMSNEQLSMLYKDWCIEDVDTTKTITLKDVRRNQNKIS